MKFWKLASAATALVLSSNVNAALIDNGTITSDTVSGLNWLDITETMGLSYDQVTSELVSGGVYEGYRYATSDEVVGLWSNFGIDLSAGGATEISVPGYDSNVIAAGSLLGYFTASLNPYGVIGLTGDVIEIDNPYGSNWNEAYRMGAYHFNDETRYQIAGVATQPTNSPHISFGSYLVETSVTTVPVPAAVWLFGSGLIGLTGLARRKKA